MFGHDGMNRHCFVAVFFCGAGFAVVVVYVVSEYFSWKYAATTTTSTLADDKKYKPFSPLPSKNEISVIDEGKIGFGSFDRDFDTRTATSIGSDQDGTRNTRGKHFWLVKEKKS